MPTGGQGFSASTSGISTVMETNHQSAVLLMRAERILPEKRNFSAILTRPSFGTSIQWSPTVNLSLAR